MAFYHGSGSRSFALSAKKFIRRARRASLKRYNAARSAFGYCPRFIKRKRQYDKAWRYRYIKSL